MSEIKIIFKYNAEEIDLYAKESESMKNIFKKFASKINEDYNNLYFLKNGEKIEPNIKLREIRDEDSEITILANKDDSDEDNKEDQFIKSKYIICPVCKKNCVIKLDKYKICLEECDGNHSTSNILIENIEDYKNTQLIDQSKITCSYCNEKKSNTFENKFYKCFTCDKNICPLCKSKHDNEFKNKEHNLINYDEMNFYCNNHYNERFNSYCKTCSRNLCFRCGAKHNKKHQIIRLSEILPEDNLKLDEFQNIYNNFKEEIQNLKNKLNKVENILKIYLNMIKDIKNNFDIQNRNYQIIKSAKNINDYNDNLINEMKKIIAKTEINDKFSDIIKLFNKMTNNYDYSEDKNEIIQNNIIDNKNNAKEIKKNISEEININEHKKKTEVYILNQFKEADDNSLSNIKKAKTEKVSQTNVITIKYKNKKNEEEINLLGDKFIHNNKNKNNFQLLINEKSIDIKRVYNKKKIKFNKDTLEVKLKILSPLTDMSYMFNNCTSIISISDIHRINTSNVTNMSYLFCNCNSLKSLPDISYWDTSSVTNMKYMFGECGSLEKLPDISKWNTSNVTDLSYMFCECKKLEEIPDISKWDTANVTNISGMFSGCSKLSKMPNLQKWDVSSISDASYLFSSCSSLPKDSSYDLKFSEGTKKDYLH